MSFFQKIDSTIPEDKQREKVEDPFLYKDPDPEIYFVTDDYTKKQISYIKQALYKVFKHKIPRFAVLYSFKYRAKDKEITKNITDFVYKYTCDYSKFIPKNSKVICIGRSIYSFSLETSFNASAFYPLDYVDSYFFHPETKSYIFPVDDLFFSASFEEKRFLDNFESYFLFKQIKNAYQFNPTNIRLPKLQIKIVEDPNAFLLEMKDKVKEVVWDLETGGLIYYKDVIICITMTFDGVTGYYLDFSKINLKILDEFFKDKFQIGANLKFDCRFLKNLGLKNVKIDFDTYNAGHCLNETASNSLSSQGWRYTFYGGHEVDLMKYKAKHPKLKSYDQIPKTILSKYAVMDVIVCFHIYKKEMEFLNLYPKIKKYYFSEVIPNLNLFLDIEINGVLIDWKYLEKLKEKFEAKKLSLANEIYKMLGFKLNLASNKDLGIALEKRAGLPDIDMRSKEGLYLTNEKALTAWSKMGYEVASKLIEYRSTCHQINSFIGSESENSAYWKYKNLETETIHPSYSVMLAQSHRHKCSAPNLQQVPKKTKTAKDFRKIFIPPSKNYYISEGDYSAFQMRIAAFVSGDENLKKAFIEYGDVHSMTAVAVFHRDMTIEEFISRKNEAEFEKQRDISKGINFAFLFGGSAWSFANDVLKLQWSKKYCLQYLKDMNISFTTKDDIYIVAAENIRKSFFKNYPKLEKWHEKCHEDAKTKGAVYSIYGARRLLPKMKYIGRDTSMKEISESLNISKNTTIQNIEVVIITRSMRELHYDFKAKKAKSRIFGMIHDAAEFYIHKKEKDYVVKTILDIFQKDRPEYDGVKMIFELNLSDIKKNEVWGFGKEVIA